MEQNLKICEERNDEAGGKSELWSMETMEKNLEHGQWSGGLGESDGKTWPRMGLFDFLERKDDFLERKEFGIYFKTGFILCSQDARRVRQVATKSE